MMQEWGATLIAQPLVERLTVWRQPWDSLPLSRHFQQFDNLSMIRWSVTVTKTSTRSGGSDGGNLNETRKYFWSG